MSSIRRRLIRLLLAAVGLLLLVVSLAVPALLGSRLRRELDGRLEDRAFALAAMTEQHDDGLELEFQTEAAPVAPALSDEADPDLFELRGADGKVLARSPALGASAFPRQPVAGSRSQFYDLVLPGGRRIRMVQIGFMPHLDEESTIAEDSPARLSLVLAVARSREELDATVRALYAGFLGGAALLLAAIAVLAGLAVRIGLAPLDAIGAQVAALDASDLASRIEVDPPVRELAPVVTQLNQLLARLQAAFAREQRFARDVAHELRTPIAELRSLAEVGGRWPGEREVVEHYFDDVREISLQMERVVTDLLALARCEAGLEQIETAEVAVAELVARSWERVAPAAAERGLGFALDIDRGLTLTSDPGKLAAILATLFANAVIYSPPGSAVACAATAGRLTVSNPAEHLTPDDLPFLFDRFWRKDAARTGGEHAGLGLAIARAFADVLGLRLSADLDRDHRLQIHLCWAVGAEG